jgi:acyl-CoA synthetase (AMP-forming)/AMP-acid ligase II
LPAGTIGEITVAGPTTTRAYFRRDAATRLAKIREGEAIVHRMGDLGYFDPEGRLWYVGRKSHRVVTGSGTLYTESVEGVFNAHPEVRRSALVGVGPKGRQRPVVCVELEAGVPAREWSRIERELGALRNRADCTRAIDTFLCHHGFPVDIRHNAKINREKLARWAARRVRR